MGIATVKKIEIVEEGGKVRAKATKGVLFHRLQRNELIIVTVMVGKRTERRVAAIKIGAGSVVTGTGNKKLKKRKKTKITILVMG